MTEHVQTRRFFAIVPAAGVGKRVGGDIPKQYLSIHGKTILEHTLLELLAVERLEKIIVALGRDDDYWRHLDIFSSPRISVVEGGAERVDSVLAGLTLCAQQADQQDWVLVHDVARPCIQRHSVNHLIDTLQDHPVGGLLAVPATDTIKQAHGQLVEHTVDRSCLWHAQTPQMFGLQLLTQAIEKGLANNAEITDEASAIELQGLQPLLVEGLRSNIKVTRPEDIALASYYLDNKPSSKNKENT